MNKNEATWLIIRTLGLLALFQATKQLFSVLFIVYLFGSGALREIKTDISSRMAFDTSWPAAIGCILFGLAAYYLLRHGRKVHALLMHENH
jgi:hypothetical protein